MSNDLPVLCCDETTTHPPHEWLHYDIDLNVHERVRCTGDFLTTPAEPPTDVKELPVALCCCGTPLVVTLEVAYKEWYCITCQKFYEYLHARRGTEPNPTDELTARYESAKKQYDAERSARRADTKG